MREKPALSDERIAALLSDAYGVRGAQVVFLPLGADVRSAAFRAVTPSAAYFLKLRQGAFAEASVRVPRFLHEQGIRQVIPPIQTRDGQLGARLDAYTAILYPYIEGRNGFDVALSADQWADFGAALKAIHTAALPPELRRRIPSETYPSHGREQVKAFQAQVERDTFADPAAAKMAASMRRHRAEIRHAVERAAQLADALQARPLAPVLCHSDIHAGNLLLTTGGALYIVDWDDPILAPKERDLMFIGGGVGGIWNKMDEASFFYQGYGAADINLTALTYYRYERIVQDIAAFGEQLLLTRAGGDDREQSFRYFASQFLPNGVLAMAQRTDRELHAKGKAGR